MHLWGKDTPVSMHLYHFAYGIGSLIGPSIALPFLSPVETNSTSSFNLSTALPVAPLITTASPIMATMNTTTQSIHDLSTGFQVWIPYTIAGVMTSSTTLGLLIFACIKSPAGLPQREASPLTLAMCSAHKCGKGRKLKAQLLLPMLMMYYFQLVGSEICMRTFLFSFATQKDDPLSLSSATLLNSLYFGIYCAGRGIGVVLAKWVSPDKMLLVYTAGAAISSVVLAILAYTHNTVLWVFTLSIGFFLSVLFPSGMSWANLHLQMNAMAVFVLIFGAGMGGATYQYMSGYFFQHGGPSGMMYVVMFSSTMTFIVFLIMQTTAWYMEKGEQRKTDHDSDNNSSDNNDVQNI